MFTLDKKNWVDVPYLRNNRGIGNNKTSSNEAIVDQLDDEVFGVPPSLITGLLTGLAGAVAGVVSLLIFFFLWEPDHYISPEWLRFVALGGGVGFFLRLEQPLFRDIYHLNIEAMQQAGDTSEGMGIQIRFGRKVDLDKEPL